MGPSFSKRLALKRDVTCMSASFEASGSPDICTISSSLDATFGRSSFERMRILAFVIFLISLIMDPPFPIRQPIRDAGTSNLVVTDIRPESRSTSSRHLGCKRSAASIVGEYVSSKKLFCRNRNHTIVTFSIRTINLDHCTRLLSNLVYYDSTFANNTSDICSRTH